jgi:hypothetical protein
LPVKWPSPMVELTDAQITNWSILLLIVGFMTYMIYRKK